MTILILLASSIFVGLLVLIIGYVLGRLEEIEGRKIKRLLRKIGASLNWFWYLYEDLVFPIAWLIIGFSLAMAIFIFWRFK
jgi:hypothetical protein